jgi:hypothetical protein
MENTKKDSNGDQQGLFLELEGKIFLVQKDQSNQIIARNELPADTCLTIISQAIEKLLSDIEEKEMKNEIDE